MGILSCQQGWIPWLEKDCYSEALADGMELERELGLAPRGHQQDGLTKF